MDAESRYSSLPSRERGLKCVATQGKGARESVAPFTGAWIEISDDNQENDMRVSLPSRERGLKSEDHEQSGLLGGRSLHGSVD